MAWCCKARGPQAPQESGAFTTSRSIFELPCLGFALNSRQRCGRPHSQIASGKWHVSKGWRFVLALVVLAITVVCTFAFALFARYLYRYHIAQVYKGPLLHVLGKRPLCHWQGNWSDAIHPLCVADLGNSSGYFEQPSHNLLLGVVFGQLLNKSTHDMDEVLSGAHVEFDDPFHLVREFLISMPGAYPRDSSHMSNHQQYGVALGDIMSTILIGSAPHSKTWLQFEGAPAGAGFLTDILHILDYCIYRLVGRQVGPLGFSSHTDRAPMHLAHPQSITSVCPTKCSARPNIFQRRPTLSPPVLI